MTDRERREAERLGLVYPEPLPEPAIYYGEHGGRYPETIRMSFADGTTEIYDRRVKQPSPRRYLNMPNRRRKRRQ